MNDKATFRSVLALALARLFLNMTRRFSYPFLPTIGRELDVSLKSVQNVVAVQGGIGVLSPVFGPLSERFGRKQVLLASVTLMGITALPGIMFTNFSVYFAAMISFGLAKIIFDPALHAYLGDRISYQQRAMAIGTTELSWAGSLIVVAPLAGYLLKQWGLSAVFLMLFLASVIAWLLIWYFIQPDESPKVVHSPIQLRAIMYILYRNPAALGALAFSFLLIAANELLMIVYGAWMEKSFDLKLEALGIVAIVIAAAEISGEFTVIGIADRVGKKQLTLIAGLLSSSAYLILPQFTFSLTITLVVLFILFIFIEIAIVTSISLFTEVLPNARAVMMSGNVAAHSIGRFSGAMLGSVVYTAGGFSLNGAAAAVMSFTAIAILWWFVIEHHSSSVGTT